jgi:hypothetical protein
MIRQRVMDFQKSMEGVEILKATEAYGYMYATLPDILKVVTPLLRKHKLWYSHSTDYDSALGCNTLTTYLYCVDDEDDGLFCRTLIDKEASLAKMNRFMIEGSAITYFRRYHLTTLLGLTTDEDTDAGGKRVKKGEGRSVEAAAQASSGPDFVDIFTKQSKTKTKAQFIKTFDAYASQMNDDQVKAVTKILIDTYGN